MRFSELPPTLQQMLHDRFKTEIRQEFDQMLETDVLHSFLSKPDIRAALEEHREEEWQKHLSDQVATGWLDWLAANEIDL